MDLETNSDSREWAAYTDYEVVFNRGGALKREVYAGTENEVLEIASRIDDESGVGPGPVNVLRRELIAVISKEVRVERRPSGDSASGESK